jgi:hypothetical protein
MQKILMTTAMIVAAIGSSGCAPMLAGALAVSTPDEIKASSFTGKFAVSAAQSTVTTCLKEAFASYRDDKGRSSFASFTYRDVTSPHQFLVSNNMSSTWSGARPELLFLVETQERKLSGTDVQLWTHPRLLGNGGSQGYFEKVQAVLRPCISDGQPIQATGQGSRSDDRLQRLEQLKGLADRGVITREDYDKKKSEILNSL